MIVYDISVENIDAAITFYTTAFDLALALEPVEPETSVQTILESNCARIVLNSSSKSTSEQPQWVLDVTDIDGTISRAIKAGACIIKPVRNRGRNRRSCIITDPFGITWELVMKAPGSPCTEALVPRGSTQGADNQTGGSQTADVDPYYYLFRKYKDLYVGSKSAGAIDVPTYTTSMHRTRSLNLDRED
ncbi:Hypothetical protein MVR_LOCUS67 [uncultured virus]|nr:Hypothetical protein MVR_LOCUS67 [uncultured virus]